MTELILTAVVAGVGLGSIYSLVGTGYTLVLASSGIFNLAQGATLMGGVLVSYEIGTILGARTLLTVPIVVVSGGLVGLLTHTVAVLPLTRRRTTVDLAGSGFLTTLGAGLVFSAIAELAFGPNTYQVQPYVSVNDLTLGQLQIQPIYLVTLGSAVALTGILGLVLRFTSTGLVMRATFQDPEGASILGVSIHRVTRRSFIVGSAVAALAGFLVAPITQANAFLASDFAFFGFAAMAIGGMGSFEGTLLGGVLVGLVAEVPQVWFNPDISSVLVYAVLLIVLITRPQGLFARSSATAVVRSV
jgi:branched-chain amino acid transport system permease protein